MTALYALLAGLSLLAWLVLSTERRRRRLPPRWWWRP